MLKSGLVSVTFRNLSVKEIVELVSKAGLCGIEWGGDIHVPHGNINKAKEVAKMTKDAGLEVASYGSYYKVGFEKEQGISFEKVLETAKELGAPTIRVWAGNRSSGDTDKALWDTVIEESRRIADMAFHEGIAVAFEYHANTLTDTAESAYKLLAEVNHRNLYCYWQPPVGLDDESCITGLKMITPWLSNIHVFHWENGERLPLEKGVDKWQKFMKIIKNVKGDRYCMIEFVKNDDPLQFLADAAILNILAA